VRRVIGMDIHRTFAEVVIWEDGRLRHAGRVDMTRTALEGFGKSLKATDEIVVEATGNTMVLVRVLSPFVARVVIANPLQVKAIAHAHVKTDKIDAGVLASLHAAGFLPEVWTPPAETERMRRLVARRPPSHANQERGACHFARAFDSALSACRHVQPDRENMAETPAIPGRRDDGDRAASPRTRPAWRGSRIA
jgi:transposase